MDLVMRPEEMNVPGFDFHPLRGFKPTRYSVHVNGPWCITSNSKMVMLAGSTSNNITEESVGIALPQTGQANTLVR
jgi:hypothetical protein